MTFLLPTALDPIAELAAFQSKAGDAGAVVSFTGIVRSGTNAGNVSSLFLQSHPVLTDQGISQAIKSAQARWALTACLIRHRIGHVGAREPIVIVAASARHRRAAFGAVDFLMDYLKTEAVFWKKEITSTGEQWIEPKMSDYADRSRWKAAEKVTACTE